MIRKNLVWASVQKLSHVRPTFLSTLKHIGKKKGIYIIWKKDGQKKERKKVTSDQSEWKIQQGCGMKSYKRSVIIIGSL